MKELSESKEGLKIFSKSDLLRIFPFGRTKLQQLLNAGVLPVVKIGKTYLTTDEMVQRWLMENVGKEILF